MRPRCFVAGAPCLDLKESEMLDRFGAKANQVDLGAFEVSVGATRVGINSSIAASVNQFLRAALVFLATDSVKNNYPHAALPLEPCPLLFGPVVGPDLREYAQRYADEYGSQSSNCCVLEFSQTGGLRRASQTWAGVATLTVVHTLDSGPDDRADQVTLTSTLTTLPLEMMIDIFVTVLRTREIGKKYPNFHAPYLRTWGADSFGIAGLKAGIPRRLTKTVTLHRDIEAQPSKREQPKISDKVLDSSKREGDSNSDFDYSGPLGALVFEGLKNTGKK